MALKRAEQRHEEDSERLKREKESALLQANQEKEETLSQMKNEKDEIARRFDKEKAFLVSEVGTSSCGRRFNCVLSVNFD